MIVMIVLLEWFLISFLLIVYTKLFFRCKENKQVVMFSLKKIIISILILVVFLSSVIFFSFVNSNFGSLEVNRVEIEGNVKISALVYKPLGVSEVNQVPGVILSHGISGSKEMMNGIGLELAKNGFVVVSMDLVGHGDSGGVFGNQTIDPTLGMKDAVQYVGRLSFVNSSKIGLVGHSLGAGAVRATSSVCDNVAACVFIAGGLGETANDPNNFGVLNSSFPANLLVAIGRYDVLFDLAETKQELLPVFGRPLNVEESKVYGNFSNNSARSLFVSDSIHLFEPVDDEIVSEIVYWMNNSLNLKNDFQQIQQSFEIGQLAVTLGLVNFVLLIFFVSSIVLNYYTDMKSYEETSEEGLSDQKLFWVWGVLGLVLFLPLFAIGTLIPFPPLIFGNSFSWWLFGTGIVGLLLGKKWLFKNKRLEVKDVLKKSMAKKYLILGTGIFFGIYFLVFVTQTVFLTDLRLATIPVFKTLINPMRFVAMLCFVPLYFVYFFVEGIYLNKLRKKDPNGPLHLLKTLGIRVVPYLVLIILNYIPLIFFGVKIFPGFVGFIVEFIFAMIPLFIITTIFSWWFYQKINNIGVGMVLNTLIFAWTSAAIFPISI